MSFNASRAVVSSVLLFMALAATAQADSVFEYASSVINYSSQFSPANWSAAQALGAPNTFIYGDIATAWAPDQENGPGLDHSVPSYQFIEVGFTTPIYTDGVTIRE